MKNHQNGPAFLMLISILINIKGFIKKLIKKFFVFRINFVTLHAIV